MSTDTSLGALACVFVIAVFRFNPLWQDPEGTREFLEDVYPDNAIVQAGGYSWFGCGRDDLWQTKFTMKDPNGKEIHGTYCEGIVKGGTLRLD